MSYLWEALLGRRGIPSLHPCHITLFSCLYLEDVGSNIEPNISNFFFFKIIHNFIHRKSEVSSIFLVMLPNSHKRELLWYAAFHIISLLLAL